MADLRMRWDDGGMFDRFRDRAGAVFGDELETAVLRTSLEGVNESKRIVQRAGRIDLGQLLNSIAAGVVRRIGNLVSGEWGTNVRHARVNEEGRRPGARQPPTSAILPWLARHGIPAEAAFVVARAIGRRGIPGIWFMRDARDRIEPLFRREVQAASRRALRRLTGG